MSQTTRSRRPSKPITPVHGSVRWLRRPRLPHGLGRLAITTAAGLTTEYDVGAHQDRAGKVTGYRLVKDDDEGYDVDVSMAPWSCSCPDYLFRRSNSPHSCKHCQAIKAALASLKTA